MFTHYKNLNAHLSESSKLCLESYNFTFSESDSRHYGHIGNIIKNGNLVMTVWNSCFYVHDKDQPLNEHTLSLISEIQRLDKLIPMQKVIRYLTVTLT